MRKEECLRRKWKEEKEESRLEICAFKCRGKKNLFYFLFHQQEIFKWDFYLIKREQVLLIKWEIFN